MKMRTQNPEQRKLDVRWSTQSWVPRIAILPANGRSTTFELVPDPFALFGKKPRKAHRIDFYSGGDSSRPTWR